MPKMSTVAKRIAFTSKKIMNITYSVFIKICLDRSVWSPYGCAWVARTAFWAVLPVTKMVTVLIFAFFAHGPLACCYEAASGLELTVQGRFSPVAGVSQGAGIEGTSQTAGLLVSAQLVRLEGEGADECVGGRLDRCRLRVVDVVLGVHGQVLLDRVVDQVEILGHAGGR